MGCYYIGGGFHGRERKNQQFSRDKAKGFVWENNLKSCYIIIFKIIQSQYYIKLQLSQIF